MSERFVPRGEFAFPRQMPNWFPGLMAKGVRLIQDRLPFIDVLIEVRDARMPLSSINPMLEGFATDGDTALSQKPRLVVYAKRDLAEKRLEKPLREAMQRHGGHRVMFCDTRSPYDCRKVMLAATRMVATKDLPIHYEKDIRYINNEPFLLQPSAEKAEARRRAIRIMCIGMPNMGKSSLINGFRKTFMNRGRGIKISPRAGETRGVMAIKVRNAPPTYVWDAPGLFVPWLGRNEAIEQGMKVALAGVIKETMADPEYLAEYLMYRLNWRHFQPDAPTPFPELPVVLQRLVKRGFAPTNSFTKFIEGFCLTHNIPNRESEYTEASLRFIRWFQQGKLGAWQLDDLGTASDRNRNAPPGHAEQLDRDGQKLPNIQAVDGAVSRAFHTVVRRSLRPHLESVSPSQVRVIERKRLRRLLGLPETPTLSEGQQRLRRLELKRQMQWELLLGPSRKSENRLNMARPKAHLLPSWLPRGRARRYHRIAQDLKRQARESIGTANEKRFEDLTIDDVDWSRIPLRTIYVLPDKYRERAIRAKADSALMLPPPADATGLSNETALIEVERHNIEREAAKEYLRRRAEPGTLLPMVPDLPTPGTIVTVMPQLQRSLRPLQRPGLTQYAESARRPLDRGLRLVARTRSQMRKKQSARVRAGVDQERSMRTVWRRVQHRRRLSGSQRARRRWKPYFKRILNRLWSGRRGPAGR